MPPNPHYILTDGLIMRKIMAVEEGKSHSLGDPTSFWAICRDLSWERPSFLTTFCPYVWHPGIEREAVISKPEKQGRGHEVGVGGS